MSNELAVKVNSMTKEGFKQVGSYENEGMPDAEFQVYQAAVQAMFTLSLNALSLVFTEYAVDPTPDFNTLNGKIADLKAKLAQWLESG